MKRREFIAGTAAILAASQAPYVQAGPDRLIIGQSLPLTGANSEFGLDVEAGVKAFLAESVGGPVRYVHKVLDDGNKPDRAADNTKKLLGEGAQVLFGYASATISKPCIPLAEAAKVPFYAPFTGARPIHRGKSPWVFTARASYDAEAVKIALALKQYNALKVAVVHYADPVGHENRDTCLEALKAEGITGQAFPIQRNAEVPPATAEQILFMKPAAVFFTTLATPSAQIVRDLKKGGIPTSTFIVALSFAGPSQFQAELGDLAKGIVVSHVVPQPWAAVTDVVTRYSQALAKAGKPRKPTFAGLEAYIALSGLDQAVRKARSSQGEAIADAIRNTKAFLGGYTLDFTQSKQHGGSFVEYTIIRGSRLLS